MGINKFKKTKRLFHRITAAFYVLVIFFSYVTPVVAADTVQVSYNVTYGQTEARSMLDALNKWRTGDTWYWDSNDTTKTIIDAGELKSLVYDSSLEKIAMQRAAEIVLSFSHNRPNGKSCSTAYGESKCGYDWGENIACGQKSAESALNSWIEENDPYNGQGHRRNMLYDKFKYIGIGHVKYQGLDFWVQEFSSKSNNQSIGLANDSSSVATVEVANSAISKKGIEISKDSYTLTINDSNKLPEANSYISLNQISSCKKNNAVYILDAPVTWTTSNEKIVKINEDEIEATGVGTVKLTARATVIGSPVESSVMVTVKKKDYIITFDPNGGVVGPPNKTVLLNTVYGDLPTPVKQGYTFKGWFTSANGGEQIESDEIVDISSDQTLYAHWTKNRSTNSLINSSSDSSSDSSVIDTDRETISRSSRSSGSSGGGGGDADDSDGDDGSATTSSVKENIKLTSETGTEQLSYQVTSKKNKTVAFAKVSKKATSVTVPATIKYNNKKYKVTSIKEKAFKGRTKLKNIELNGSNIRSVGDDAFKGIKKNAQITIIAKNKKQYNKVVKLIKESETGKVKYAYKKK